MRRFCLLVLFGFVCFMVGLQLGRPAPTAAAFFPGSRQVPTPISPLDQQTAGQIKGLFMSINTQLFGLDASARKFEERLNQQDNRIKWLEERLNHIGAPG